MITCGFIIPPQKPGDLGTCIDLSDVSSKSRSLHDLYSTIHIWGLKDTDPKIYNKFLRYSFLEGVTTITEFVVRALGWVRVRTCEDGQIRITTTKDHSLWHNNLLEWYRERGLGVQINDYLTKITSSELPVLSPDQMSAQEAKFHQEYRNFFAEYR